MKTPFELAQDVQAQITKLLSAFDIDSLPPTERAVLHALKRQAAEARLDIRDYGLAETAAQQQRLATEARQRLRQLDESIVKAGSLGLIGPADVAVASAVIQQLMSEI